MKTGLLVVLIGGAAAAEEPLFVVTDTEFTDAHWFDEPLSAGGSFEAGQQLDGGNPGAFRLAALSGAEVAHLCGPTLHYPATAPVTALTLEFEARTYDGAVIELTPMVFQAGAWFRATSLDVTISGDAWTTAAWSIDDPTVYEIVKGAGPAHPDFGFSGLPLTFGFASSDDGAFGIDNFRFVLNPGCAADCNCDGAVDVLDFVCFQSAWMEQSELGDCDGNGVWNVLDFVCFQALFAAGCS